MKRLPLFLLLLLLMAGSALAEPVGPIATEKRGGKFHLGVGYVRAVSDWETRGSEVKLLELQENRLFGEIGIGIGGRWQTYLRGGVANLSMEDGFFLTASGRQEDGEDSYRPFASLGAKGAILTGPRLTVGPFLQGTYHSNYEDQNGGARANIGGVPTNGQESIYLIDRWGVQTGLVIQGIYEGAVLYGGPLVYAGRASHRSVFTSGAFARTNTLNIKEEGIFGGFVGIRWSLNRHLTIEAEAQLRSAVNVGIALQHHF